MCGKNFLFPFAAIVSRNCETGVSGLRKTLTRIEKENQESRERAAPLIAPPMKSGSYTTFAKMMTSV